MDESRMEHTAGATPTVGRRVTDVSRRARAILNVEGNRLALVLAQILVMLLGVGTLSLVDGIAYAATLVYGEGSVLLEQVALVMGGILLIILLLPLATGVYRMAVLAVAGEGEPVSLAACLYPFTSCHAYLRTMAVGGEALLILIGICVPCPLAWPWAGWIAEATVPSTKLFWFLLLLAVGIGLGCAVFLLACRRAGWGYLVFTHPDIPLRELTRRMWQMPVRWSDVAVLRLRLVGWSLLSALPVLVPLLVHTIPYACLTCAVLGQAREEV